MKNSVKNVARICLAKTKKYSIILLGLNLLGGSMYML